VEIVITGVNLLITLTTAVLATWIAGIPPAALLTLIAHALRLVRRDEDTFRVAFLAVGLVFLVFFVALLWPAGPELGIRLNLERVNTDSPFLQLAAAGYLTLVLLGAAAYGVIRWLDRRDTPAKMDEWRQVRHARRLLAEIEDVLKYSPISDAKKSSLRQQADEIPTNIATAALKLYRVRRLQRIVRLAHAHDLDGAQATSDEVEQEEAQVLDELAAMEQNLLGGMKGALQALRSMPVTLMRVELARDERAIDRLLANLDDTNRRVKDLADAYHDLKPGHADGLRR
jgi:hypothetical protein